MKCTWCESTDSIKMRHCATKRQVGEGVRVDSHEKLLCGICEKFWRGMLETWCSTGAEAFIKERKKAVQKIEKIIQTLHEDKEVKIVVETHARRGDIARAYTSTYVCERFQRSRWFGPYWVRLLNRIPIKEEFNESEHTNVIFD